MTALVVVTGFVEAVTDAKVVKFFDPVPGGPKTLQPGLPSDDNVHHVNGVGKAAGLRPSRHRAVQA